MKTFRDIKKGDTIYSVFLNDLEIEEPLWHIEEVKVHGFAYGDLETKDSINSFYESNNGCPTDKLKLKFTYPGSVYILTGTMKADSFDKEFFVDCKERGLAINKDCIPELKRQMINKYIEYAQYAATEHRKTVELYENKIEKYDKWMSTID